jgi:hypothetical protein
MIQLVLISLALTSIRGSQDQSADLEARWRREYPGAVERLEQAARVFSCEGTMSFTSLSGETIVTNEFSMVRDHDKKVLIRDRRRDGTTNQPFTSDAICLTDRHAFRLVKPQGVGPYVVEGFTDPSNWATMGQQLKVLFDIYAEAAYSIRGRPLLAKMQEPSFTLERIGDLQREGESLVRVDYSVGAEDKPESGMVLLDPSRDWAIREYDIGKQVSYPANDVTVDERYRGKFEYAGGGEAGYFPNRIEMELRITRTPKPDAVETVDIAFDTVRLGDFDENVFTLSNFGVADIPLTPSPPPSSFFSLRNPVFWASLLVAVGAFVLHRSLRRRPGPTSG